LLAELEDRFQRVGVESRAAESDPCFARLRVALVAPSAKAGPLAARHITLDYAVESESLALFLTPAVMTSYRQLFQSFFQVRVLRHELTAQWLLLSRSVKRLRRPVAVLSLACAVRHKLLTFLDLYSHHLQVMLFA
jgi:hypothetical protein